jgi:flagellar basal-body rod modification protein FlgD
MTVASVNGATAAQSVSTAQKSGFATLGQADFFKLMTTQMQQQDPFNPVDNKEMLAQMAQFSSLAGISDVNTTLKSLGDKLDAVVAAQQAAATAAAATNAAITALTGSGTATATA